MNREPSDPDKGDTAFTSLLYNTGNSRVDDVSDAGVALCRFNVKGDGRCLFRAIVQAVHMAQHQEYGRRQWDHRNPDETYGRGYEMTEGEEEKSADYLRSQVVEELKLSRELFTSHHVIEDSKFDEHIKRMSRPDTFGGEPELDAMAKLLRRPIVVYESQRSPIYDYLQTYGKPYRGIPIRLCFRHNRFYDVVVPVSKRSR